MVLQPITLYSARMYALVSPFCQQLTPSAFGPNPWKVLLSMPHSPQIHLTRHVGRHHPHRALYSFETTAIWDATDLKKEPFVTEVNPNGRAPGNPPSPSQHCGKSYAKATHQLSKTPTPASSSGSPVP